MPEPKTCDSPLDMNNIHAALSYPLCMWTRTNPARSQLFLFLILSGVRLSPLGTAATSGLLYQLQMIGEGDCGAIGGMKIGKETQSTRRTSAPAQFCPPQIPHDQIRVRIRAAAVGSQRLSA
jgi:hypothetical protein